MCGKFGSHFTYTRARNGIFFMPLIKDFIQVRLRLRQATKQDLSQNKQPVFGTVYFILQKDNTVLGPYVLSEDTDLKELNYQWSLHRIYVEETQDNKHTIVELYK